MKPAFNVPIAQVTPESFEEMCRAHDLTYEMSNDHTIWQNGCDELRIIMKARDRLGSAIATPIWNKIVLSKISQHHAKQFLWEE